MSDARPTIPAAIRRRVLVEAGHRCAIPTCRHIDVDVHHIVPWETCQKHEYENLISLCPNCHRRARPDDIDRKSLRIYKANLRFTHDRFSQLEVDVLFEAYRAWPDTTIQWLPIQLLLIKRLLDANYIEVRNGPAGNQFAPRIRGAPLKVCDLVITTAGKEYIDSLGVERPEEMDV